ncbi:MAG TPA: transposase [Vicinamibacterales bacterium]|nr:transposase [Vicinamibacterales bacterium]
MRLHFPGVLLHVFARGNDKAPIFLDDGDCRSFLQILATTLGRFGIECVMYCLLRNHYHLLLVPHEHPVSRLMQQLNATYCQRFNRRHGRVGHVLQGRFGSRLVQDGDYARTAVRYLALNPVAAGMAQAPDDWAWCSYRAAVGLDPSPDFLCLRHVWAAFGTSDPAVGRDRLTNFVRAAVVDTFENPFLHGDVRLFQRVEPKIEPHRWNGDFVYADRFATRLTLGALLEGCMDPRSLEDAAHAAFHYHGYTLAAIAAAVHRDPSTVCRWIQRAAARVSAGGPLSSEGVIRARNKI